MLTRRIALEAVAFAIAVSTFSCVLHAAEAARHWRPATEADLPAGTVVLPGTDSPGSAVPAAAAGVRVHIDTATGAIVPAPADNATEAAAAASIDAAAPPLVLKKSPSGLLYVDTSEYRHSATVTLDSGSHATLDCEDPPQDAATAASLAGKAPPLAPAAQAAAVAAPAEAASAAAVAQRRAEHAAARTAAQQQRLAGTATADSRAAATTAERTPTRAAEQ